MICFRVYLYVNVALLLKNEPLKKTKLFIVL